VINRKAQLISIHVGKNNVKEVIDLPSRMAVNIGKGMQTDFCTVKISVNTKAE